MNTPSAVHPIRARRLWLLLASGLTSLVCLWLTLTFKSPFWSWATVTSCALTVVLVFRLWRARRQTAPLLFSPKVIGRLALFTVSLRLAAAVGVEVWIAYAKAYTLVHPARLLPECAPEAVGINDYTPVTFLSSDGLRLNGWYAPTQNGAAVIVVHGFGGNRCELLWEGGLLARAGYGVLLFDLHNYGESEGGVTTLGLTEVNDVRGAVDWILTQPGVEARRIGLLGHSMGGATVLRAGARIPEVSAVLAESAYTSLEDNIRNGVEKVAGLPPFPFAPLLIFFGQREAGIDITQVRPIDDIASISPRPVLLIHGEQDDVMPVANSYALYAAANEPKELYIVPGAGHNDMGQVGGEVFAERVAGFFNRALLQP